MSRLLRVFVLAALTTCVAAPVQAQTAKPQSPGEMATMDRATTLNRTTCDREARAKKLSYLKRRRFVRDCVKH
jgi:hypothetical protein